MQIHPRLVLVPMLCLVLLGMAGCGSPPPPTDTTHDAGFVAVCDLSDDLLGWKVATRGEITFIDLSPPDGVYAEIVNGGCQIGLFFHNDFWLEFSDEQQSYVAYGTTIEVSAIVAKPEGRLILSGQTIDLPE